jgi:hypothetical protein
MPDDYQKLLGRFNALEQAVDRGLAKNRALRRKSLEAAVEFSGCGFPDIEKRAKELAKRIEQGDKKGCMSMIVLGLGAFGLLAATALFRAWT